MRVKICGVTNIEDALLAVELGAWALGFNFYEKSPRYISAEKAQKIIAALPKSVVTVGVFVNASFSQIEQVRELTKINMIQLHGDETLDFCRKFTCQVIKVVRPVSSDELEDYSDFYAVLIDTFSKTLYGGTGHKANFQIAAQLAKRYKLFLAGGLNAENVADAITAVQPNVIDVCSGVEESPGQKSLLKMQNLFKTIFNITEPRTLGSASL